MADTTNTTGHRDGGQVSDLMPRGRTELTVNIEALRRCDMKGLHDFRSVVRCLSEMLCGFTCQPRFGVADTCKLNAAGELLDDIGDLLLSFEQAAVNVAKASSPADTRSVEYRAWTILGFEADCCDDLSEFAVLAATAARDEAGAAFRERHAQRQ
jgi:hypothetical protein